MDDNNISGLYWFWVFSFFRMEETVRTLLQYKSKFEQLKQDRHSVANSYEVSFSEHFIFSASIWTFFFGCIGNYWGGGGLRWNYKPPALDCNYAMSGRRDVLVWHLQKSP